MNVFPTVRPVTTPGPSSEIPTSSNTAVPLPHAPESLAMAEGLLEQDNQLDVAGYFDLPGNHDRVELNGAAREERPIDGHTVGAATERSAHWRDDEKLGTEFRECPA